MANEVTPAAPAPVTTTADPVPAESTATFPPATPSVTAQPKIDPTPPTTPQAAPAVQDKGQPPAVPEKYTLALPKDSPLNPKQVEKIEAYAKERGFSNEQAQGLLERESGIVVEALKIKNDEYLNIANSWQEKFKADKEIGGKNADESVAVAHRLIEHYGSDELKTVLSDKKSRIGDYPELIRMLVRISKDLKVEGDNLVLPGPSVPEKKSKEEMFYGMP